MRGRYEKWSLLVEVSGVLAVAGSIFLLSQQTTAQVESLRSSSYIAVNSKQLELDSIFPHCQESCQLGLIHPPGGLTDDHEKDLRPRCAGASPRANESTKPGERG